jgi:hypothetical protein
MAHLKTRVPRHVLKREMETHKIRHTLRNEMDRAALVIIILVARVDEWSLECAYKNVNYTHSSTGAHVAA